MVRRQRSIQHSNYCYKNRNVLNENYQHWKKPTKRNGINQPPNNTMQRKQRLPSPNITPMRVTHPTKTIVTMKLMMPMLIHCRGRSQMMCQKRRWNNATTTESLAVMTTTMKMIVMTAIRWKVSRVATLKVIPIRTTPLVVSTGMITTRKKKELATMTSLLRLPI